MNCLVHLPVPEQVFSFPFASRVVGGGDVLENRAVAREIRNRLADSRDDVRDLAGDIPQRIRDENLINNGRERDAVPALPPAI